MILKELNFTTSDLHGILLPYQNGEISFGKCKEKLNTILSTKLAGIEDIPCVECNTDISTICTECVEDILCEISAKLMKNPGPVVL